MKKKQILNFLKSQNINMQYFKECFYEKLSEHDKYIIDLFTIKKSFKTQWKKVFLKEKYKAEKDLLMRIMFILWEI